MKRVDFEKLTKEKEPQDIIRMHIRNEIYLTNKQLDELFELRGKNYWKWRK